MLDGSQPAATIDAMAAEPTTNAGQELRQFIERIERLNAEKQDVLDMIKEAFSEAKGRGYLTTPMRKIIAIRKRDAGDVAEEDAITELYKSQLGM
jgi:uncharacterized protein (UPF0335 family)